DGSTGQEDARPAAEMSVGCRRWNARTAHQAKRSPAGLGRRVGISSIGFRCVGLFFHQETPFRLGAFDSFHPFTSDKILSARPRPAVGAGSESPSSLMIPMHSSTIWQSSAYTAVSSSP